MRNLALVVSAALLSTAALGQEREPTQLQITARIYTQRAAEITLPGVELVKGKQFTATVQVISAASANFIEALEQLAKRKDIQLMSAPVVRTIENMPATVTTQKGTEVRSLTLTAAPRGRFASMSIEGTEPTTGGAMTFNAHTLSEMGKETAIVVSRGNQRCIYLISVAPVKESSR